MSVIRSGSCHPSVPKEFSLTANYPKGHGKLFREWIIKNYPLEFLLHAERASGSRQDLICMGADAIYMKRPLNVEFLDQRLRIKGNDNILQKISSLCCCGWK